MCGPLNQSATGKLDPPACAANGLKGTASDPNVTTAALRVVLWFDGTAATNKFLDLKTAAGKFSGTLPSALHDGKAHSVIAYTYDTTDTAYKARFSSPAIYPPRSTCAPPQPVADLGAADDLGPTDDLAGGEPGDDAGGVDPDSDPVPQPGAGPGDPGGSCALVARGPIAASSLLLIACALVLLALRRRRATGVPFLTHHNRGLTGRGMPWTILPGGRCASLSRS